MTRGNPATDSKQSPDCAAGKHILCGYRLRDLVDHSPTVNQIRPMAHLLPIISFIFLLSHIGYIPYFRGIIDYRIFFGNLLNFALVR